MLVFFVIGLLGDPRDMGKILEGVAFDMALDNNGKNLDAMRY